MPSGKKMALNSGDLEKRREGYFAEDKGSGIGQAKVTDDPAAGDSGNKKRGENPGQGISKAGRIKDAHRRKDTARKRNEERENPAPPGLSDADDGFTEKSGRTVKNAGISSRPEDAQKPQAVFDAAEKSRESRLAKPKKRRRKKRKSLRRVFEGLLSCPLGREEARLLDGVPGRREGMTVNEAIAAVQVAKAIKGDAKAFELIRNTVGDKSGEGQKDFSGLPKVILIREDGG